MATDFSEPVPIPPKEKMNPNLTPAREDTMLGRFGKPGPLTKNCSPPSATFAKEVVFGVRLTPKLRVSGLKLAVASLQQVFKEIEQAAPEVFAQLRTAGMLCVRARRTNPSKFSNHSWGTAIDLFIGEAVIPQGEPLAQRGLVEVFEIFNRHGWYWGAEFSGDSVDSMHFEWSEESIGRLTDGIARMASRRGRRRRTSRRRRVAARPRRS
jgi:hypothetical protein